MTAQTLEQPRIAPSPSQPAGWSAIAGGLLGIILGIPLAFFQAHVPTLWWIPV